MKIAGRTLILIFLFAFAMHEVNGNDFLSNSGFNKYQPTGTHTRNSSYQNLRSGLALNRLLYYSVEENDKALGETSSDILHSSFAKHLSCLFEGLVGGYSCKPVPDLNNTSIITAPIIVPRYILYHSLRIPAA